MKKLIWLVLITACAVAADQHDYTSEPRSIDEQTDLTESVTGNGNCDSTAIHNDFVSAVTAPCTTPPAVVEEVPEEGANTCSSSGADVTTLTASLSYGDKPGPISPTHEFSDSFEYALAKGETHGFLFKVNTDTSPITFSCGGAAASDFTCTFYKIHSFLPDNTSQWMRTSLSASPASGSDKYYYGLLELAAGSFEYETVSTDEFIWVDILAKTTATAGEDLDLDIIAGSDCIAAGFEVFNFSVPVAPSVDTLVEVSPSYVDDSHWGDYYNSEDQAEVVYNYVSILKDHRISNYKSNEGSLDIDAGGSAKNATSVDTGTDYVTIISHGYVDNLALTYNDSIGSIGGLTDGTTYFVLNKTTNTFQVSATAGGAAIDLTSYAATPTFTEEPSLDVDEYSARRSWRELNLDLFPDSGWALDWGVYPDLVGNGTAITAAYAKAAEQTVVREGIANIMYSRIDDEPTLSVIGTIATAINNWEPNSPSTYLWITASSAYDKNKYIVGVADSGGSLNGTYMIVYYGASSSACIWIDVDDSNTPANAAAVAAECGNATIDIEVNGINTGDSASAVESAWISDVTANANFTASSYNSNIKLECGYAKTSGTNTTGFTINEVVFADHTNVVRIPVVNGLDDAGKTIDTYANDLTGWYSSCQNNCFGPRVNADSTLGTDTGYVDIGGYIDYPSVRTRANYWLTQRTDFRDKIGAYGILHHYDAVESHWDWDGSCEIAASSGSLDQKYFFVKESASSTRCFWIDESNLGSTVPAACTSGSDTQTEITTINIADSTAQVETKLTAAIHGVSGFTAFEGGDDGNIHVMVPVLSNMCKVETVSSVNTSTETITVTAHGFLDDVAVIYYEGSTAIGGLVDGTVYYVLYVDADSFQLETSVGSGAINLTSSGTGTHRFAGGDTGWTFTNNDTDEYIWNSVRRFGIMGDGTYLLANTEGYSPMNGITFAADNKTASPSIQIKNIRDGSYEADYLNTYHVREGGTPIADTLITDIATFETDMGEYEYLRWRVGKANGALNSIASHTKPARRLEVAQQPTPANVDAVISPAITVKAKNVFGALDTAWATNCTISKASGTGNMSGTTTVAPSGGICSFSDISFDASDTFTMSITSTGVNSTTTDGVSVAAASIDLNDIGTLDGWWRADNVNTSGGNVIQWNDKRTGGVDHLDEASVNHNDPLLLSAEINGLDAVQFDKSNTELHHEYIGASGTDFYVGFVFRVDDTSSDGGIIGSWDQFHDWSLKYTTSKLLNLAVDDDGTTFTAGTTAVDTSWHYVMIEIHNDGSDHKVYLDGSATPEITVSTGTSNVESIRIGGLLTQDTIGDGKAASDLYGNVTFVDVAIWKVFDISGQDYTDWKSYVTAKYGL